MGMLFVRGDGVILVRAKSHNTALLKKKLRIACCGLRCTTTDHRSSFSHLSLSINMNQL